MFWRSFGHWTGSEIDGCEGSFQPWESGIYTTKAIFDALNIT